MPNQPNGQKYVNRNEPNSCLGYKLVILIDKLNLINPPIYYPLKKKVKKEYNRNYIKKIAVFLAEWHFIWFNNNAI